MESNTAYYADLFAAMGSEPRLKIMQLLFKSYPRGMVVGEIKNKLKIPNSTLSHHLEKLRIENLVEVEKDKQYLCYTVNAGTMEDLLSFFYTDDSPNELNAFELSENLPKEEKSMSEQLFRPIWNKLFTSLGFPLPFKFTREAITAIRFAQCESLRSKH